MPLLAAAAAALKRIIGLSENDSLFVRPSMHFRLKEFKQKRKERKGNLIK